jgi:hypothetical protein
LCGRDGDLFDGGQRRPALDDERVARVRREVEGELGFDAISAHGDEWQ